MILETFVRSGLGSIWRFREPTSLAIHVLFVQRLHRDRGSLLVCVNSSTLLPLKTQSPRAAEQCDVNLHSLTHATEDPPYREGGGLMHVKSIEVQCPPVSEVWCGCLERMVRAQLSSSSLDRSSKLRVDYSSRITPLQGNDDEVVSNGIPSPAGNGAYVPLVLLSHFAGPKTLPVLCKNGYIFNDECPLVLMDYYCVIACHIGIKQHKERNRIG
ncbi:hypothetical protein TNCV_877411 [Trichonephila clavipes]|nr:hypothetical protein TNCV_877411 [Trichonephila clavipes]